MYFQDTHKMFIIYNTDIHTHTYIYIGIYILYHGEIGKGHLFLFFCGGRFPLRKAHLGAHKRHSWALAWQFPPSSCPAAACVHLALSAVCLSESFFPCS